MRVVTLMKLRAFRGEGIFLAKYITISDTFTLEILQACTDIKYELI